VPPVRFINVLLHRKIAYLLQSNYLERAQLYSSIYFLSLCIKVHKDKKYMDEYSCARSK
jgi:hypothetical protein